MKLHAHKLGLAGAIFSALAMLVLSIVNAFGIYTAATEQMQTMHMFYTPDVVGTITGMIEAAVITYISLFVFVLIYNKLLKGVKK
ncbi:MAG: hypothetical protein ABIH21_04945 [Patescibacteria group bacterium]